MTTEYLPELSPPMQHAMNELKGLVLGRYPQATFAIAPSQDSPDAMHLITTVDVEDPDEVVDLVLERVLHFQLEEGLPVHVVPIRPLPRVLEDMRSEKRRSRPRLNWEAMTPRP